MSTVDKWASAFKGNAGQYAFAQEVGRQLDSISNKAGGTQLKKADVPNNNPQIVSAPPPAQFAVSGIGTAYTIQITNPQNVTALSANQAVGQGTTAINAAGSPLYHILQSASDLTFNANVNLVDFGSSPQTSFNIPSTGRNQCWRFRSSYDGKTWNAWQTATAAGSSAAVNASTTASGAAASAYEVLPFAPTPVFDATQFDSFEMTLTGDVTASNCPSIKEGQLLTFVIIQDSVGGRTFAFPANIVNPLPVASAPNTISVQSFLGRSDGDAYAYQEQVIPTGISGTATLAALTLAGTQGSITFVDGLITAVTNPT